MNTGATYNNLIVIVEYLSPNKILILGGGFSTNFGQAENRSLGKSVIAYPARVGLAIEDYNDAFREGD